MSTADAVIQGIEIAERIATAIAGAFSLDRREVLRVAREALPPLVPIVADEGAAYEAARDAAMRSDADEVLAAAAAKKAEPKTSER